MSMEPPLSQSRCVLSPIAAARIKKKMNRKQSDDGQTTMVDSFLQRFTTRRKKLKLNHHLKKHDASVVIEEDKEEEEEEEDEVMAVVVPDGDFLLYWLAVVSIAVVYNLWVVIAREAWPELQEKSHVGWFVIDYFCDFIYILDIVVQARTAYLEEGLLVLDGKKLLRHYLRSWQCRVDLLSLLPTDLFYLLNTSRLHPIVRCPRFLRVYRFYSWYIKVETRTHLPNLFRVLYLTHILLLGLHWTAAAYYVLCEAIGHRFAPDLFLDHAETNTTLALKYLVSFYWSTLTLTTIGDLPTPHTEIEYVVQIIGYLMGIFIFATVVGQVGDIIGNRNATRMDFERQVDNAKRYMRRNNVPRDVQLRILRWYDYTWARGATRGQCDINSLGLLPDTHRTELALHVNLKTLKKVSILKFCPPEFLHDLVLKMHLCIFTPDDLVCKKNAVAKEMFIVSHGSFKVTDDSGKVVSTLKSGDYFGEIGILNVEGSSNRRTANVYSVGFSELFSLSKDDVLGVLKDYPSVKSMMEDKARQKLERLHSEEPDCDVTGTDDEKNRNRADSHSEIRSSNPHVETREDLPQTDSLQDDETKRTSKTGRYVPAKKRTSSTYSGLSGIAMEEIVPVERVVSEKIDILAGDTDKGKDRDMEAHKTNWILKRENESKAAYIQALEKRNKELEALLKATSPFQASDT
ncbi:cyclic nucleotide-gated cation channel alpha-3 isoform X2 [Strongylocentrotus purpuratus]|uniref:Cyclic nucleotide-binding domain-containing protein n=1 Tax=Strongylocentrotus purpuratus TaxID=7668 RepID=A0A7M7P8C1_STRPU|nr:cyclic nucleotide-gated cation channel alpha-3 isoform X2 [Strongylocentrotus purpuratus]